MYEKYLSEPKIRTIIITHEFIIIVLHDILLTNLVFVREQCFEHVLFSGVESTVTL